MTSTFRWAGLAVAVTLVSCHDQNPDHHDEHGHAEGHHGDEEGHHGEDHGHGASEESIQCTTWAQGLELFVEIDSPTAGKTIEYRAHLTELDAFAPVTTGNLALAWKQGDRIVLEGKADAVARPGIFMPKTSSPEPGEYELGFQYSAEGKQVRFECGTVVAGKPQEAAGAASLSFTKEQQWSIPFATDRSVEREMAQEFELPAVVEPAGTDQLTISAPTSGRFFHNPEVALAEGLHIKRGQRVGNIAPTVAGDDFSELTGAVDAARIGKDQALAEVKRIKPLVADGLLPEKRLIAARNEVDRQNAKLQAARARLGRVVAPGGAGGLTVKSSLGGVVTEVLVANGEQVAPGAPLLRIGGEGSRWLRARFVVRPDRELDGAEPIAVRTPSGKRLGVSERARMLSEHPIVDPRTQLATWVAQVDLRDAGHGLRSGTPVVLIVSAGKSEKRVAVPRGAVVDINTRPYVFVQAGGELFEKRRVTLGVADNEFVEVRAGLKPGERIVTRGGYDIHLASVIGSVESHRH